MRDELIRAITRIWMPRLKPAGFTRLGTRDPGRVVEGIVQVFHFQVSAGGSRHFCVHVAARTICGAEHEVLSPGFRLAHPNGADVWLPSWTADEAAASAERAWAAAVEQALPFFEATRTLEGLLGVLRTEKWGSQHHQHFQMGVVEALLHRHEAAADDLRTAIRLYLADGRD